MFSWFKKKTKEELLMERYNKLMEESYKLSHTDREASSKKAGEADAILKEIDALNK